MRVIDNFLPSYQFNQIYSIMMGSDFPWYYNPTIVNERADDYIEAVSYTHLTLPTKA